MWQMGEGGGEGVSRAGLNEMRGRVLGKDMVVGKEERGDKKRGEGYGMLMRCKWREKGSGGCSRQSGGRGGAPGMG